MKLNLLFVFMILALLHSCETTVNNEISSGRFLTAEEEKEFSKLKSIVECNICNPTQNEIYNYYRIKNKELISKEQIRKYRDTFNNEPKPKILNPEQNEFLGYDFTFPPPKVASPPFLNRGRNNASSFFSNSNGYRQRTAPIHVKPGHQF